MEAEAPSILEMMKKLGEMSRDHIIVKMKLLEVGLRMNDGEKVVSLLI